MKNAEIEELRLELEAISKREGKIHERIEKIRSHERDASAITVDERLAHLHDDADPSVVNYILGQSAGYVDGFRAAIHTVIETMASEYRDIPMTEDELYMLAELGEVKERAWLKDYKQRQITEGSGWYFDLSSKGVSWKKGPEKQCGECESCEECEEE